MSFNSSLLDKLSTYFYFREFSSCFHHHLHLTTVCLSFPAISRYIFCSVHLQTSISLPQSGSRLSNLFVDSSSDSAGSSDAELSEGDILDSDVLATKGGLVKEGFLMKKVPFKLSSSISTVLYFC